MECYSVAGHGSGRIVDSNPAHSLLSCRLSSPPLLLSLRAMAALLLSKPCSPRLPSLSSRKTPNSVHLCLSSKPYSTFSPSFSSVSSKTRKISATLPKALTSPSASYEPQKGAEVLLESLELMGVDTVFTLPGDSSMEIHQLLTRSDTIRGVPFCHAQASILAAEGYARASGRPGVCIASSGPGATNLVTGLADALLDGVPVVAITCQVPLDMMGTDAETPIIEVTKPITKHNYLVQEAEDIPRIVNEAFILATTGHPGPVLIDIPKDLLQKKVIADWGRPMKLHLYLSSLPKTPELHQLEQILRLVDESKKPLLLVGGGCLNSSSELRRFSELTGIPVTSTLMGIGIHPSSHELSMGMLGMHGTVKANYAVDRADLLLAFGVRFTDKATCSELKAFAHKANIVHIDIDRTEIGKNKQPHFSICGDVNAVLEGLISLLKEKGVTLDFSAWRKELREQKMVDPLSFNSFGDAIHPLDAIQVLDNLTDSDALITTGAGQHQIWVVKAYNFKRPRQLLTSGGLVVTGFGLPAAIGAAKARPGSIVVDIEGGGSFNLNIQELAVASAEYLPVKIMILNNQHLGLVARNFLKFAEGCNIPTDRVTKKSELMGAIKKMLETPGPYLLELVLPVLPSGGAFGDWIIMG